MRDCAILLSHLIVNLIGRVLLDVPLEYGRLALRTFELERVDELLEGLGLGALVDRLVHVLAVATGCRWVRIVLSVVRHAGEYLVVATLRLGLELEVAALRTVRYVERMVSGIISHLIVEFRIF